MAMLDQHPLVQIATVVTLVVTIAGGTWFIIDERDRSIDVSKRAENIRLEQEKIHKQLSGLTLMLNRIEDNQKDLMTSSNNRFEVRAGEHRWLASEINRVTGSVAIELGKLQQMHSGEGH